MASEPIPEPLTNQEVRPEDEASFAETRVPGPELVAVGPPTPPERELPSAPKTEQLKQKVQEKVEDLKETVTRTTARAREQAAETYERARDTVANAYSQSRDKTAETLQRTRLRSRYYMDEYPLRVIAGVGAAAFVMGIILRIWRSNRNA